jgi:hypothetical protein
MNTLTDKAEQDARPDRIKQWQTMGAATKTAKLGCPLPSDRDARKKRTDKPKQHVWRGYWLGTAATYQHPRWATVTRLGDSEPSRSGLPIAATLLHSRRMGTKSRESISRGVHSAVMPSWSNIAMALGVIHSQVTPCRSAGCSFRTSSLIDTA